VASSSLAPHPHRRRPREETTFSRSGRYIEAPFEPARELRKRLTLLSTKTIAGIPQLCLGLSEKPLSYFALPLGIVVIPSVACLSSLPIYPQNIRKPAAFWRFLFWEQLRPILGPGRKKRNGPRRAFL